MLYSWAFWYGVFVAVLESTRSCGSEWILLELERKAAAYSTHLCYLVCELKKVEKEQRRWLRLLSFCQKPCERHPCVLTMASFAPMRLINMTMIFLGGLMLYVPKSRVVTKQLQQRLMVTVLQAHDRFHLNTTAPIETVRCSEGEGTFGATKTSSGLTTQERARLPSYCLSCRVACKCAIGWMSMDRTFDISRQGCM